MCQYQLVALGKSVASSVGVFMLSIGDSHFFPPYLTGTLQDFRYDRQMTIHTGEKKKHYANERDCQILDFRSLLSQLAFPESG